GFDLNKIIVLTAVGLRRKAERSIQTNKIQEAINARTPKLRKSRPLLSVVSLHSDTVAHTEFSLSGVSALSGTDPRPRGVHDTIGRLYRDDSGRPTAG